MLLLVQVNGLLVFADGFLSNAVCAGILYEDAEISPSWERLIARA